MTGSPIPRERIAVVGAGAAGLTAAYVLSQAHDVSLFEAQDRLGGHAHTHDVGRVGGGTLAVDTGFIVHNDRTYPLLRRLFAELGVTVRPTEMSMSIRDEQSGIEYAGGRGLSGFLARPGQLLDPRYVRTLASVRRFYAVAREFLRTTDDDDQTTFGELIRDAELPDTFVRLYAVPVVACVWSTGGADALDYPARYLLRFLEHHGMLAVGGSPQWYTVEGGSRRYVDAVARRIADVRIGRPVRSLWRDADGVHLVEDSGARQDFDRVVIATHPDEALALLADPTPTERTVLSAFRYSHNETVLHSDLSLLPVAPRAQASWNYLVRGDGGGPPLVTYWMNRLQGLPADTPLLVTLNGADRVDPAAIIATMDYAHPLYDLAAVRAQRHLPGLSGGRTAYAGAYHGWGFHEDAVRAGVAAAAAFGVTW